jgi:predicted KAP-like P-loop ATPase
MAEKKRSKSQRRHPHQLLADVPVGLPQHDELGRSAFIKTMATTIKSMKGLDSFVFGLCGPWGSGKSSILKLVMRELQAGRGQSQPIIINFNPWWFSGKDQLLQAFLEQLASALAPDNTGNRLAALGSKLTILGKLLRPLSWIPGASVVRDVSEMLEEGGKATQQIAEQKSADINRLREEIDDLLKQESPRIVIVMDDIDRLTAHEIAQLFLIVKSVADFPNTVYLLAFDHAVVARAISETLRMDGESYLEKIVQVQIDIPSVSTLQLQTLFLSQLGGLLNPSTANETSQKDFANLFHDGIKDFFKTPRSVKRLTNVLRVLFPAVEGEVYWPDFIGIISLMVFVPEAFRTIRQFSSRFVGVERSTQRDDRDAAASFHKAWIEKLPSNQRGSVLKIVQRLFPRVKCAFENHHYGNDWESRWKADLRVCSPDCFDRYFQLRVPEGEFSESEWKEVVEILDAPDRIDECIRGFCQTKGPHGLGSRAKEFLERASLFAKHHATVDQAKSLFEALMRNGDHLLAVPDTERVYLVSISNDLRLSWALQEAVERIEDVDDRQQFLESCFSREFALRTGTHFLWLLGAQHGKFDSNANGPHEPHLVSVECVDRLLNLVIKSINAAAGNGTLARHPRALLIASDWKSFGEELHAREWVQSVVATDEQFVWLVGQATSMSARHNGQDRVTTEVRTIDAKWLVSWIDGMDLRQRAKSILAAKPKWLTRDGQQTLQLLMETIDETGKALDQIRKGRRRTGGRGNNFAVVETSDREHGPVESEETDEE